MSINFKLPRKQSQQNVNADPFPGVPVMTMHKHPVPKSGKKVTCRFSLNQTATDLMGFTFEDNEQISVGFGENKDIYLLRKEGENDYVKGIKFSKNLSFASKPYFIYLKDLLDLDVSIDNHFRLSTHPTKHFVGVSDNGKEETMYSLTHCSADELNITEDEHNEGHTEPAPEGVKKLMQEIEADVEEIANSSELPDID